MDSKTRRSSQKVGAAPSGSGEVRAGGDDFDSPLLARKSSQKLDAAPFGEVDGGGGSDESDSSLLDACVAETFSEEDERASLLKREESNTAPTAVLSPYVVRLNVRPTALVAEVSQLGIMSSVLGPPPCSSAAAPARGSSTAPYGLGVGSENSSSG